MDLMKEGKQKQTKKQKQDIISIRKAEVSEPERKNKFNN